MLNIIKLQNKQLQNLQIGYRIYKLVIEFTKYLQNLQMPPKQKKVEEVMCLQVVVIDTPLLTNLSRTSSFESI